eukprot:scaffold17869_cov29-Tisochrysis_lutea.AAC.3
MTCSSIDGRHARRLRNVETAFGSFLSRKRGRRQQGGSLRRRPGHNPLRRAAISCPGFIVHRNLNSLANLLNSLAYLLSSLHLWIVSPSPPRPISLIFFFSLSHCTPSSG